jgi:hypothetical protein
MLSSSKRNLRVRAPSGPARYLLHSFLSKTNGMSIPKLTVATNSGPITDGLTAEEVVARSEEMGEEQTDEQVAYKTPQ